MKKNLIIVVNDINHLGDILKYCKLIDKYTLTNSIRVMIDERKIEKVSTLNNVINIVRDVEGKYGQN